MLKERSDPFLDQIGITYDVTQWLLDYPKARGYDYGFVRWSDSSIEIFGDASSQYSPRIELPEAQTF